MLFDRNYVRRGAAALAVLGTLFVSACSSSDSASSGAKALNVILVNTPWARAITPHVAEFEKQTGIKVNVQQFAQAQARDKIFVSLSSKSSDLDVFNTLPSNEGQKWAPQGLLQPLDDYFAKASSDYHTSGFSTAMLGASRLDGKLVGVPVNVEGPVVYYRTDLLQQYGVQVPNSIDSLVAAANAIHEQSGGKYITATRGQSATVAYTFGNFLHNEGVEWAGSNGTPNFTDPRAEKAIAEYTQLAGKDGPKGVVNNGPVQNSGLMAAGNAVFEIDSSNELESVAGPESKVAAKLGVMPIPPGSDGSHPTLLSWDLGMSHFSKHKDEAWKFIQWATSPSMMLELSKSGIAPPRSDLWTDPTFLQSHSTPVQKQWVEAVQHILQNGSGLVGPPATDQSSARKVVGDEIDKVILGRESAKDASANIQKGLEPLLTKR